MITSQNQTEFDANTANEALSLASFFIHERGTTRNGEHIFMNVIPTRVVV